VLVAEDDVISRRRLEKRLAEWGYDVVAVEDGKQAWEVLQGNDPPPLALLDWMMPKLDGPEICTRLRQNAHAPYTYVILVTGKSAVEDIVAGLEAGADDYVAKPFNAQELEVRLRIGRRIVAMQAELQVRATRDPLTGAWNRRASTDALTRELERARRTRGSVAAILADIDHFKLVNDENGHLAGDEVLSEFVRRLTATARPYDTVGRYGGEEFLVVLADCDEAMATGVAERMRANIDGTPFSAAGRSLTVSASFGVAAAQLGETLDGLLARVDEALYNAKNQGRNRVVIAGTTAKSHEKV